MKRSPVDPAGLPRRQQTGEVRWRPRAWRSAMVLVGVALVVAAACGGGGSDGADHNPGELFPDRANQYREDQERAIGDAARLSGYTTTVTGATYDGDGTVTVSVRIENRDDEPQPMYATDWQLVSPDVTTYDPVVVDAALHGGGRRRARHRRRGVRGRRPGRHGRLLHRLQARRPRRGPGHLAGPGAGRIAARRDALSVGRVRGRPPPWRRRRRGGCPWRPRTPSRGWRWPRPGRLGAARACAPPGRC